MTRKELAALFDVIGTPTWADVDGVAAGAWRAYLQRLPGRAPTLFRRLGYAGGASSSMPSTEHPHLGVTMINLTRVLPPGPRGVSLSLMALEARRQNSKQSAILPAWAGQVGLK